MKTMKRIVALLLGGVMMLGLLAGCGKKLDADTAAIANSINAALAEQGHAELEEAKVDALYAAVQYVATQDSKELLKDANENGVSSMLKDNVTGYGRTGFLVYSGKLSSEDVAAKIVAYINDVEENNTNGYVISGISIAYANDKNGTGIWVVAVANKGA